MNKRDQMNASYAVADALLGKHTGVSRSIKHPRKPKQQLHSQSSQGTDMAKEMTFGNKPSVAARGDAAKKYYGNSKPANRKPDPKMKVTVKPTGGLTPNGVKIKATKQFSSGKWVK
ncbi:MAG: hypothetical protein C0524_19525 [Rhodobacter sp.]|nr:hypothetical protein [Rhodobacter sp.]